MRTAHGPDTGMSSSKRLRVQNLNAHPSLLISDTRALKVQASSPSPPSPFFTATLCVGSGRRHPRLPDQRCDFSQSRYR